MNKKISWGASLSLMIIVVAVTVCVTMLVAMRRFNAQVNELSNRQTMYNYIADVDNAVRQNYYGAIDEEVLRRSMASGEVGGIGDKYAAFLTNEEYSAAQEALSGQSTGFGLEVALGEDGRVVLSAVQRGSTAYSAGLQKGDVVTALNKTALGDDGLEKVRAALDSATSLILTVNRDGKETAFELSAAAFTRISVESRLTDQTGYIRIKSITDATPDQFKSAYSSLKEQGATALVVDLRGTGSGSPEAAKKLLSFMLPYGLYGYYMDNNGTTELRAEDSAKLDMSVAVLIDGGTTGEAELVAAALKQANQATLVGTRTAGCSMVQGYFPLTSDNSAVRITVGEFRLLNKQGWEGVGVTPDVEVAQAADQEVSIDILKPAADAPLQAAIAALNGDNATTTTPATTTTAPEGDDTTAPEDGATSAENGDATDGANEDTTATDAAED